jgi:outer membrane protein assembly factor BamB
MGYDIKRTGYNPTEHTLGVSNVGGLHALWAQSTSIGGQIGEPVYASAVSIKGVKTNVLYATSGGGEAVAINADTGAILWKHQMSTASYMCGSGTYSFGADGTPVLDRAKNRIYASDGAANVHALNMSSGAEITGWPINIAAPASHNFIYGALTYNKANHTLYAETSSTCDISPWYGRITAINTTSATITNTFYPAQGASGGGIWGFGGASIDPATNDVYIAVGNGDTTNGGSQTAGYSEQVVALSADLSTVLGNYYAQLPPGADSDFGATPLLFKPHGCPLLAAAVNKSGLFVLYTASNISAGPAQTIDMSIATDNGDFIGVPAYDPVTNYVYVGLPATFGIYKPGLGAFSVQANCTLNPTPAWNAVFGADGAVVNDDTPRSPVSIANGVVYVSDYDTDETYAFNAATGAQLWSHALSGNGIVGPIVANGHLYTSDITGKLNAWTP